MLRPTNSNSPLNSPVDRYNSVAMKQNQLYSNLISPLFSTSRVTTHTTQPLKPVYTVCTLYTRSSSRYHKKYKPSLILKRNLTKNLTKGITPFTRRSNQISQTIAAASQLISNHGFHHSDQYCSNCTVTQRSLRSTSKPMQLIMILAVSPSTCNSSSLSSSDLVRRSLSVFQ